MPYGKLITSFTTRGHDIFITCPTKKKKKLAPGAIRALGACFFFGTGDENIIPTYRSAGNNYLLDTPRMVKYKQIV